MWIMLKTKLPTNPSPPKMSLFWSVEWPMEVKPKEEITARGKKRKIVDRLVTHSTGTVGEPDDKEDIEAEFFWSLIWPSMKEPNRFAARKIRYKEEDIRIFPHEFVKVEPKKMMFYLDEGAYDLMPGSAAESQLIGSIIDKEQKLIYESALALGASDGEALIVALGKNPFEGYEFPPIGWYKLKEEYASVFCYDNEMGE